MVSGVLREASALLLKLRPPFAFMHFDTRSDNIRLQGKLMRIFDWNFACAGPIEFDVAAFAQTVTMEGGPEPERIVAEYDLVLPLRPAALDASIAGIAGYFADRAWRPPTVGLPRIRSVQRRQLKATLACAARHFDLPEPLIEVDQFGEMTGVIRAPRNIAYRLIEEFMLAGNEAVASHLQSGGLPSIYRIHEQPNPKRVMEFEEVASHFGYSLGVGAIPVQRFAYADKRRDGHRTSSAGRVRGTSMRPSRMWTTRAARSATSGLWVTSTMV